MRSLSPEYRTSRGLSRSAFNKLTMPSATMSKGEIKPIVQMALRPDPEMTKLNVSMIFDFIKAEYARPEFTVEQAKAYFTLVISTGFAGRPYFVAPEVPPARVKALRDAFDAMVKDAVFLAEAEKQKRELDYVSGNELQSGASTPESIGFDNPETTPT